MSKRIFIIGGGESLKGFDFNRLAGEDVLALNIAYQFIKPTILLWMDRSFYENHKKDIDQLKCLKYAPDNVTATDWTEDIRAFRTGYQFKGKEGFTKGIYAGNPASTLSGLAAISLSTALSYEEIYLLGFDGSKNHFHNGYRIEKDISHKNIRYHDIKGLKVFNCSLNSKIDAFPKVTIDAVLKDNKLKLTPAEKKLSSYLKDKRIAIIGNAKSVLDEEHPEIDSYDVIVRFNKGFPQRKKKYVGSRTDILVVGGIFGKIYSKFKSKYIIWTSYHHKVCNYQNMGEGKDVKVYKNVFVDELSALFRERYNCRPSTGCYALYLFIEKLGVKPENITLYGFDHFQSPTWYPDATSNLPHSGKAEADFVKRLLTRDKVTIITPTRDRKKTFALCRKWMERQTLKPSQWIVVDDGKKPLPKKLRKGLDYIRRTPQKDDPAHTLKVNILEALKAVKHDKVIFVEDDDWYHPEYIERMAKSLNDYDLVGQDQSIYYFFQSQRYRKNANKTHASLCTTGFRKEVLHIFKDKCLESPKTYFLDLEVWENFKGNKYLLNGKDKPLCVGMKGLPGRLSDCKGAFISQGDLWDKDHSFLRDIIGEDIKVYQEVTKNAG